MSTNEQIQAKFQALLREADQILSNSGWDGSRYYRHPSDIDYRRFRAEAMNLIRRVCGETSDHYQELKRLAEGEQTASNSYYFKDCVGVLQAAKNEFTVIFP